MTIEKCDICTRDIQKYELLRKSHGYDGAEQSTSIALLRHALQD